MINIRLLQLEDCFTIASAHTAHLNTPFKTAGGTRLLQSYYEVIASLVGGVGYVATIDNQIAGFVCGIWDRKAIRKAGLKKIPALAFNGIRHVLEDPQYILDILGRLTKAQTVEDPIGGEVVEEYELRPIVVLPEFRGQGVAEKLVEQLLTDAKKRGFDHLFLFTEQDNYAAIKFYSRVGFVLEGEEELHAGTSHATTAKLFRYYLTGAESKQ